MKPICTDYVKKTDKIFEIQTLEKWVIIYRFLWWITSDYLGIGIADRRFVKIQDFNNATFKSGIIEIKIKVLKIFFNF